MVGAFLKYFGTPINLYNRGKRRITQALSPTNSPSVSEDEEDFSDHLHNSEDDDVDEMPGRPKRARIVNDETLSPNLE